eukprot:7357463-Heterocapsa_arctica.AAC.1
MARRRSPTVSQRLRFRRKQGPEATRTSSCWSTRSYGLRPGLSTGPVTRRGGCRVGRDQGPPELLEGVSSPVRSSELPRRAPSPVCD